MCLDRCGRLGSSLLPMATLLAEKLMFGPFHVFAEAAAAGVTFLDVRPSSITDKKKKTKNCEAKLSCCCFDEFVQILRKLIRSLHRSLAEAGESIPNVSVVFWQHLIFPLQLLRVKFKVNSSLKDKTQKHKILTRKKINPGVIFSG